MGNEPGVVDLTDCLESRQALLARPPQVVHGALLLMLLLLGVAGVWAAATDANLVVRASGRVRPVSQPQQVFSAASGENFGAAIGGRVVEVNYRQGDHVARGQVLIRLDTEQLDNQVTRSRRSVENGEEQLQKLARLEELLARQFETARARAQAELSKAQAEIAQEARRRQAQIDLARLEVTRAEDTERRVRGAFDAGVTTAQQLFEATAAVGEANARLELALLPVDDTPLAVLRRAVEAVTRDYAVKHEELQLTRQEAEREIEAARLDLAALELEGRHAVILAPSDGVVTSPELKVGDVIESGRPVVAIAPQARLCLEIAVPAEDVGDLRVGMPAKVKLDAFDYQKYGTVDGVVQFVSPDSEVTEIMGRHVAVYTVRVVLDEEEFGRGEWRGRIKLGMTGQAEIVTGQEDLLSIFVRGARRTVSLG